MAIGDIKTFEIIYPGLTLQVNAIDLGGGKTSFDIQCLSGSADINALYWSDGDATAGEGTFTGLGGKSDSALNMNGSGQAWDGGIKLSSAGLGKEGLAKATYLQAGESYPLLNVMVNWDTIDTLGIRATSTSTADGSIKGVDTDGPVTEAPCVSIDDVTVTEGTDNFATFTVELDEAYLYDVKITYTTANGTALSGSDYAVTSGTLTIAAGQTSATISVPIIDDDAPEATETFVVNITGFVADIPGDTDLVLPSDHCDLQGVGTILDIDQDPGPPPPPGNDFPDSTQNISHITLYFDQSAGDVKPKDNLDGYYLVKIDNVPGPAPDDLDDWIQDVLDWLEAEGDPADADNLLGVVIKAGNTLDTFFAYGSNNSNGDLSDPLPPGAPTPSQPNLIDQTYEYSVVFA